jgi:hypothetical protein
MKRFIEGLFEVFGYSADVGKRRRDEIHSRHILQRGTDGMKLTVASQMVKSEATLVMIQRTREALRPHPAGLAPAGPSRGHPLSADPTLGFSTLEDEMVLKFWCPEQVLLRRLLYRPRCCSQTC